MQMIFPSSENIFMLNSELQVFSLHIYSLNSSQCIVGFNETVLETTCCVYALATVCSYVAKRCLKLQSV